MIHLTAHVEDFFAALPEMLPMLPQHWEELALDKDQVPLDPRWDAYRAMYLRGELLLVTLRERGRLIGYSWTFIMPHMHYGSTLTATMDIFWIDPEYRGRMGGKRLFRAVEAELCRRGVKRWMVGSKLHKDSSRLFLALGFRPAEVWLSKMLGAG
jgi:GNAT superfamily N-acetyltransferase